MQKETPPADPINDADNVNNNNNDEVLTYEAFHSLAGLILSPEALSALSAKLWEDYVRSDYKTIAPATSFCRAFENEIKKRSANNGDGGAMNNIKDGNDNDAMRDEEDDDDVEPAGTDDNYQNGNLGRPDASSEENTPGSDAHATSFTNTLI